MILERLKALWNLPTLLHNEAHTTQSALDRVTDAVRMALQRTPPAFVLVLLQGQLTDGRPFVAAMSGEVKGSRGPLRLSYSVQTPIASLTVLVFCDLQRVRIISISADHYLLALAARFNDSAPMAHHSAPLGARSLVIVELEAR